MTSSQNSVDEPRPSVHHIYNRSVRQVFLCLKQIRLEFHMPPLIIRNFLYGFIEWMIPGGELTVTAGLQARVHALLHDRKSIEEAGFINGLVRKRVEEESQV
jgi:hypothetical protein